MKVAFLSESPADEGAIRILTEGLLGATVESVELPSSFRVRGWGSVAGVVPAVMKHVHYRTDCSGLVVVIDSNRSAVHQLEHDDARCRLCMVRQAVNATRLPAVHGKPPLSVALGLAVPAIEAWYLCGLDAQVGEVGWATARPGYTINILKERIYGRDRPSLALETAKAAEAARRLVEGFDMLEQSFPGGFGPLAATVRSWRTALDLGEPA